jgi:hypothetical protein
VAVPALMQLLNERDALRHECDQALVLLDEAYTRIGALEGQVAPIWALCSPYLAPI